MRLKFLLTSGIVLLLSTFASSNECARYTHKCEGRVTPRSAKPAKPGSGAVTADTESTTLVINKLLYI